MMEHHGNHDIGRAQREEARRLRRARHQAARVRARRARITLLMVIAAVVTLVGGWKAIMPSQFGIASNATGATGLIPLSSVVPASADVVEEPPNDPVTPIFATYRELPIFLPVLEHDLTEVAFHQASGVNALALESAAPDADMEAAANKRGTGRVPPPVADADPPALGTTEPRCAWRFGLAHVALGSQRRARYRC
jgi:hypothetical protein